MISTMAVMGTPGGLQLSSGLLQDREHPCHAP
jgi:hypothetical protein